MNGAQEFDEQIKYLKDEITQLKTAHVKTATKISTMDLNKNVSFSLMLDALTGQMFSTQRAIITMTSSNSTNMISACYLDGATPSNLDSRFVFINRIYSDSGKVKFEVVVLSQNQNDYNTLAGGGSVNLNYTIKLIGSSKFTASVDYRGITGGSS
jgi:hypothetical protein